MTGPWRFVDGRGTHIARMSANCTGSRSSLGGKPEITLSLRAHFNGHGAAVQAPLQGPRRRVHPQAGIASAPATGAKVAGSPVLRPFEARLAPTGGHITECQSRSHPSC
jgi:hypothetical protein